MDPLFPEIPEDISVLSDWMKDPVAPAGFPGQSHQGDSGGLAKRSGQALAFSASVAALSAAAAS